MNQVKEKEDLHRLTWMFFILISLEAFLSTVQTLGMVGQLWPDYWIKGYKDIPVGTLGPHHLHLGTICMLGTSLGLYLLKYPRGFLSKFLIVASICAMISTSIMIMSRSGWVGIIIVIALFLWNSIKGNKKISGITVFFWLAASLACFIWIAGEPIVDNAENQSGTRRWRKDRRRRPIQSFSDEVDLIVDYPNVILNNPYVLLVGSGSKMLAVSCGMAMRCITTTSMH